MWRLYKGAPRPRSSDEHSIESHEVPVDRTKSYGTESTSAIPGVPKSDTTLSITDFDVLSKLGEGGFGTVLLVRKKSSGKLYALKVLVKRNMRRSGDARRAISESAAMQEIKHPFVVTLHYAFQDANHVYFVLEFVGGGDLYSHLERQTFPEAWAQLYIAEIALAIAHVHKHEFVYRDLKPENILVAHDGHVKLADFGLAKKLQPAAPTEPGAEAAERGPARGRLNTMIGTMAFSAPEMFLEKDYGKSVDWWALGLLFCEMITGDLPLVGLESDNMNARLESFKKGKHLKPLPRSLSKHAADLIKRLLTVSTQKRMCCGAEGVEELKRHPFFDGLDWDKLYAREIEAPLKPLLGAGALDPRGGGAGGGGGGGGGGNRREVDVLEEEFGMYVGEDEVEIQSRYAASTALCEAAAHSDLGQLRALVDGGTPVDEGDYDRRTALHLAASEGLAEVVGFLIEECGANISPVDRWGNTPLDDAIRSKHKDVVDLLLAKGARKGTGAQKRATTSGSLQPYASSEVCDAAARGDVELLRQMRAEGVDLGVGDYDKRTPIHLAASEGALDAVKYLAEEAGCALSPLDRWGYTPVDDAARSRHAEVEAYLRAQGGVAGAAGSGLGPRRPTKDIDTAAALIESAANGDLAELRRIVAELGADAANKGDYDKRTALHLAASEGLLPVVEFLVDEAGARVNPVDRWGGTPLDDAIRSKHKSVAAFLTAQGGYTARALGGADAKHTAEQSMNLCDAAAQGNLLALRVLIAQGADVDQGDYDKRTALHLAASEGRMEMAELLVKEARADVSPVDRWGGTPLDDAIRHKHDAVVEYLTKAGATRGTRQDATVGDMCEAAAKGDVAQMRQLKEHGVDVNAGDYDMRTPIHLAASEGLLDAVQFLAEEAGASVSPVDRWGGTPLDDARRHGHAAVAEYLLARGAVKGAKRVSIVDAVLHSDEADAAPEAGAPGALGSAGGGGGGRAAAAAAAAAGGDGPRGFSPKGAPARRLRHDLHAALMCHAAAAGKVEQLKELVARSAEAEAESGGWVRGFGVNDGDYDKRTPLHLAAAEGQLEAVRYLVDQAAANPSLADRWGATPLDEAERERHDRVAQFLVERGAARGAASAASIQMSDGAALEAATCAMCFAAARGQVHVLHQLAQKHGPELASSVDYDSRAPLHVAAAEGRLDACRQLLESLHVDSSPYDRWGHTPLDEAVRNGHDAVVVYLRERGARPGVKTTGPCHTCAIS